MDQKNLIDRLSRIKLLFNLALNQSYQNETVGVYSILTFHDCVEMFLELAAEEVGMQKKPGEQVTFMQYWERIPSLQVKESMNKLNERRKALKHRGITPAKIEIEASRINSLEFFEQNTPIIFNLDFAKISLFDLIVYEQCKSYLKKAKEDLDNNKIESSVENSAIAFHILIYEYKENKKGILSRSHFEFTTPIHYRNSFRREMDESVRTFEEQISKAFEAVDENFKNLEEALEILSYGFNYRKYMKFKVLAPSVSIGYSRNIRTQLYGGRNWTVENCSFLIDFVLECAIHLQEVDYDLDSLDLTRIEMLKLINREDK